MCTGNDAYIQDCDLYGFESEMLEVDNKGAVDLANSWSHGGRTKHMQVRNYWLRELKEKGLIRVKWIPGKGNVADMLTKILNEKDFKRHREIIVS